jgi:hypothetical protein
MSAAPLPRLESSSNNVTETASSVVAFPHRCRCRTCPTCGPKRGWLVRQRLLDKVGMFVKPAMLTCTLDRRCFASSEEAHRMITEKRFIARFLRLLGVKRWVWVLEFQTKSGDGWPHWHILIDLGDLPNQRLDLSRAWALWRDRWKLGGLDLSYKRGFDTPKHAVMYITKYLTKMPEAFPVWVLLHAKSIRFVGACKAVGPLVSYTAADDDPAAPTPDDDAGEDDRAERSPLLTRMSRCGMSASVMHVEAEAGGEPSFKHLRTVAARPTDLPGLGEQGLISVRASVRDFNGRDAVFLDTDSVGGIGPALDVLGDELEDRDVGYAEWRDDFIRQLEWGTLERHATFWARSTAP